MTENQPQKNKARELMDSQRWMAISVHAHWISLMGIWVFFNCSILDSDQKIHELPTSISLWMLWIFHGNGYFLLSFVHMDSFQHNTYTTIRYNKGQARDQNIPCLCHYKICQYNWLWTTQRKFRPLPEIRSSLCFTFQHLQCNSVSVPWFYEQCPWWFLQFQHHTQPCPLCLKSVT